MKVSLVAFLGVVASANAFAPHAPHALQFRTMTTVSNMALSMSEEDRRSFVTKVRDNATGSRQRFVISMIYPLIHVLPFPPFVPSYLERTQNPVDCICRCGSVRGGCDLRHACRSSSCFNHVGPYQSSIRRHSV
jgi:hypothetical protein